MDPPAIGAETFVLKTYISSRADEKKVEKLLENIQGVHRISIDPTEIGKITILGTMDPKTVMKILWHKGIYSEQVFEPMINPRDLPGVSGPETPVKTYHAPIDKETVEGLEKLSKLKGFDTVELTKDATKLKYKKDENIQHLDGKHGSSSRKKDENIRHADGKNGSSSRKKDENIRHPDGKNGSSSRNMNENAIHKKSEHTVNNYCDYHGNCKSHCPKNQGMSVQDSHDCGTNSRYMAPPEGIPKWIPSSGDPEYNIFSEPPFTDGNDPYPRPQKWYSDHGTTNKPNDDNRTGIFVFFYMFIFLFVLISLLQIPSDD